MKSHAFIVCIKPDIIYNFSPKESNNTAKELSVKVKWSERMFIFHYVSGNATCPTLS